MNPITLISGQYALKAFNDNGFIYGAKPIEEYLELHTGNLAVDEEKWLDFEMFTDKINFLNLIAVWTNFEEASLTIHLYRNNKFCGVLPSPSYGKSTFIPLNDFRLKILPSHPALDDIIIFVEKVSLNQRINL